MRKKLSVVAITLLVSACENTTTTHYPNGKPEPGYIDLEQQGPNYSMSKGVLRLKNLSKGSSYFHMRGKKDNGEVVEGYKIKQLPDVSSVVVPGFKNNNVLQRFLDDNNIHTGRGVVYSLSSKKEISKAKTYKRRTKSLKSRKLV